MKRLWDAEELAAFLGVKVTWVWRAARKKDLPCVYVGRYVRFDIDQVLAALVGGRA